MYVSVIGGAECGEYLREVAYATGREIAVRGHILVCGGLGGVMDAAAHGAHDSGGVSVGVLPGHNREFASNWLTVSIPTDMGHARNAIVAWSGDALIAVGGSYGTLSEIAFGIKMGKPVIGLETWDLMDLIGDPAAYAVAESPQEAVSLAERMAGGYGLHELTPRTR